jgi:general stress protein 26
LVVLTKQKLLEFLRTKRYAVVATMSARAGAEAWPEAALVGFAVTPELELIFDTVTSARKWANLRANPNVAVVIGWDGEVTLQLEGVAEQPEGEERERRKEQYFATWPDGRERASWPGITWIVIRLRWARYCDYGKRNGVEGGGIEEMEF